MTVRKKLLVGNDKRLKTRTNILRRSSHANTYSGYDLASHIENSHAQNDKQATKKTKFENYFNSNPLSLN